MISAKLLATVKAVRLSYSLPVVLLLLVLYSIGIHPWMTNWGSTEVERQMALPGDDLHPDRAGLSTLALTINAPSDVVWQWLVQIGQDRAGFYTYTWLENLTGADIHNVDEIRPEWQRLAVGDSWRLLPPNYLWGLADDGGMPVLILEPGRTLVVEMFGAHVIVPLDEDTSRLIVRGYSDPNSLLNALIIDPLVFTMERRMLLGLKARAEGRPDAPAALTAIAQLGWAVAAASVVAIYLRQRQLRLWLVIPVVATLPAMLASNDFQAAQAAFIAVGISLLGFLICGRSWWGAFLILAAAVLLTLLLAPEAYVVFGIAFTLMLVVALGVAMAGRARSLGGKGSRVATSTR